MMHVVLGDGEMTRRELNKTLEDLLEQAGSEDFWFLVQGKAEPTGTDKAMMEWLHERVVWFAVITDDKKGMADIYEGAQETHEVKRLAPKVLSLMQERPTEGEDAALYGLFVNNDSDVPEDTWLNDVMTLIVDGGYKVFAMNDGLVELGWETSEEEAEEQEEIPDNVVDHPAKKAAAKKSAAAAAPTKKAAAKPPPPADDEEEAEEVATTTIPTRDELEELNAEQLRKLGAAKGLEFPPRTRMTTMINALLGENGDETPEAEVEPVELPEPEGLEATVSGVTVTSDALLVVVFNGTVVSRTISVEEAQDLVKL